MWVRCIVLSILALFPSGAAAEGADLTASRGELYLRLADRRVLSGEAIEGSTLLIRQSEVVRSIRIDRVDVSAAGPTRVLLYTLSAEGPSPSERRPLCRPEILGRQAAIPLAATDGAIRLGIGSPLSCGLAGGGRPKP